MGGSIPGRRAAVGRRNRPARGTLSCARRFLCESWGQGEETSGRREMGWRRKNINEPDISLSSGMVGNFYTFFARRNAVESGVDPGFGLHYENLVR